MISHCIEVVPNGEYPGAARVVARGDVFVMMGTFAALIQSNAYDRVLLWDVEWTECCADWYRYGVPANV